MLHRSSLGAIALAALLMTIAGARAFDDAKYPDLTGQWRRLDLVRFPGQPGFDPSKPPGRGQQAPLTPEYQAIFEANLKDQAEGGQGTFPTATCLAPGMPMMMTVYEPMEIIVTPETTYILIDHVHDSQRRIYTDGRDWPEEVEPSFAGYSIGQWVDADGDGRYDALLVETRHMKGPRAYDASGLPLHSDNQTIVKERIHVDKADRNVLHDDITVIDHALTRPWTVTKNYRRDPNPQPVWPEYICAANNPHVRIGKDSYFVSADGYLMPAKKDQAPPDLRYFKASQK
jgi:hypothetical protein